MLEKNDADVDAPGQDPPPSSGSRRGGKESRRNGGQSRTGLRRAQHAKSSRPSGKALLERSQHLASPTAGSRSTRQNAAC